MSCDEARTDRMRLHDSGAIGLTSDAETTVLETVGEVSSADVWFVTPVAWPEQVIVRLYARLGAMRVLLGTLLLRDARGLEDGGNVSGLALSVRGRPCTGFELTLQRLPGGPSLENGRFVLQVGERSAPPATLGGPPFGDEWIAGPIQAEPHIALVAGQKTDSGTLGDRFQLLKLDSAGNLVVAAGAPVEVSTTAPLAVEGSGIAGTPAAGVLTVQGPAAGVLSVAAEGTGTPGSPVGGVLTIQGPISGGALAVKQSDNFVVSGDDGGFLNVKGARAPSANMPNPTGAIDAGAFLFGWDGSAWDRVAVSTPSDALANPADALASAAYTLGWDGSAWKRARIQPVSSVASISNASAPAGLAAATFGFVYDSAGSQWLRVRADANGQQLVVPQGSVSLSDNVALSGTPALAWSVLSHRNQAGNWYLSRGGYTGVIAAAAAPAVLNVLGSAAFNSSAPSPASGDAVALQANGRGSLVVAAGRPANDARDTPTLAAFNGVDKGVIKASAGNLLSLEISSRHTGAVWLHIVDKATNPANGDAPLWRTTVAANAVFQLNRSMLSEAGIRLSNGIAWAISTTRATVTLVGGTPDVAVNATYV
ncbi:MAG: hypothetical protein IPM79_16040 [Polyangiaceae bacterium]|nr:hypothetical protein [Polyangiaceae bacterium]MBK8939090.1 hypothetical protein [Polyangiaceae bacterium]